MQWLILALHNHSDGQATVTKSRTRMGTGASCADRSSTSLNEKLRTMLILRAYNCRPRDWTVKDQFEAAAENGLLTKDHLRKALRLGECPRIEALLDRCCLFDQPEGIGKLGNNSRGDVSDNISTHPPTGSISVGSLISFVENGSRQAPKSISGEQKQKQWRQQHEQQQGQQQFRSQQHHRPQNRLLHQQHQFPFSITSDDNLSRQNERPQAPPRSPPSSLPTTTTPVSLLKASVEPPHGDARSHGTADLSTPPLSPTLTPCQVTTTQAPSPRGNSSYGTTSTINDDEREAAASNASVIGEDPLDTTGVNILSPRIVPLTSKWALVPPMTPANVEKPHEGTEKGASTGNTPILRGDRRADVHGPHHSLPSCSVTTSYSRRTEEPTEEHKLEDGKKTMPVNQAESRKRGGGHCTTLVRHLGAVLGLRGKEAYRRRGSGQPVWRKRETLIQERIVQYTTLDEEGTVQELLETEKSQTEVLHMECKRTGEFAHSESTHYESGETFNGEVVLEETGVERYVHLRSVDDEYEHLESTLPSRARNGGAAGGVGGTPAAEEVESGPGTNETRGRPGTTANGGSGDGGGDGEDDGGGDGDGGSDGGSDQGVQAAVQHLGCDGDDGPCENDGRKTDSLRYRHQPETGSPDGSEGHAEYSPAAFMPPKERANTVHHDNNAARGTRQGEERRRTSRAERNATNSSAAAENYSFPSSPYHYRSPSCSPRLSPRPARSPYRQEGVGERVSSGRGEVKQRGHQGQRQEEMATKVNSPSSSGHVSDPKASVSLWPEVSGEEGHAGQSVHADGTGAWDNIASRDADSKMPALQQEKVGTNPSTTKALDATSGTNFASPTAAQLPRADSCSSRKDRDLAGCVEQFDACIRSEAWRDSQQSKRHPETGSPRASIRRTSRGDASGERAFRANYDGHMGGDGEESIGSGGFGNGYGGSVIFFDNQDGQDEGKRGDGKLDGEEDWWPESGSVLGGLAFPFQRDTSSVVCATSGIEVDVTPDHGQVSPDKASQKPPSIARLAGSALHARNEDATDEDAHVSRLIEGLRSSDAPLPVVLKTGNEEECHHHNGAVLDHNEDINPSPGAQADQMLTGPAPFDNSV